MSDHEPYGVDHGSHDDSLLPGASQEGPDGSRAGGRRRGRKRRSGCLPVLLVLAVVAAAGFFLVRSIDVKNPFASDDPEDYAGPGTGQVTFTVSTGDSISAMGTNLEELGVVASREAYVQAAGADTASRNIGEGVYKLKKEMKAADVVDLLVSGKTAGTSFTFTSGKTTDEVLDLLAKSTGVSRKKYDTALADRAAIGLPKAADDNAEGYLAPGSYTFFPGDDATTILSAMVARTEQTLKKLDVEAAAERLDYDEHDLVTVASLVEAEGSLLDEKGKAKIARVIYNRLENPGAGTVGFLQLDATVNYALGEKFARLTTEQIESVADSPYNTYKQKGLPPGPIGTPSKGALEAAFEPAKGDWFYYVTVNLETGETKFAETNEEFLELKGELDDYCANESDSC
jgi:UPF0755 protein